ncbi:MAG: protoporphyrinogen/coproporphyrinogen oxidase [Myxococcota bacterium]
MAATSPEKPTVLVVGAGITGLSAAWLLARAGYPVEVHDAAPEAGGLLAPVQFRGLPCDRGSHRIHPESHPLLRELTSDAGWIEQPRRGRLVLGGRQMAYPPQVGDFLKGLGARTAAHMGINFLTRPGALAGFKRWEEDRKTIDEDVGFESFVTGRVGRRAYTQFYAPYVEKVWGLHPNDISQTVAKARISTASPLTTLSKAIKPGPVPDRVFLYPRGGMVELVEFFQTGLTLADVPIHYDSPMGAAEIQSWPGPVLYSGHLSDLVDQPSLQHRGLYLIHIAVPKGSVGQTDTFYLPEREFWFGRVSQPARFSDELADDECDVLCLEIPEGRWGTDHDFSADITTIQQQLVHAGIIPSRVDIGEMKQTFVPRVYPMYKRNWTQDWSEALRQAAEMGQVFPIGRQGLFLHCNIDQCVYIADEAVRHLTMGGTATQWIPKAKGFLDLRVRD